MKGGEALVPSRPFFYWLNSKCQLCSTSLRYYSPLRQSRRFPKKLVMEEATESIRSKRGEKPLKKKRARGCAEK
jgi:hypothetical protein